MSQKCQLLIPGAQRFEQGVGVTYSQVGLVLFPLGVREVAALEWNKVSRDGAWMPIRPALPSASWEQGPNIHSAEGRDPDIQGCSTAHCP